MKKLITFIFTLLLSSVIFAQSLEISQPLQMIENSSVMVQYQNRYGKHNMPDKDIPFPFALICIRLEGSGTEVTAAQQVVDLFMGSQTMVADVERSLVNEIQFLVPTSAKNLFLRCGNGCEEQVLASGVRLRPNTVYYCQVKYTPEEIEYGPKKPVITSQYLLINVTPSNAIVEVDGNLWTTNNGVAGNLLDFGEHSYRVSAPDHAPIEGKVTINDPNNTQSVTVQLKPRFCSVTLKVENNAEIWVNGTKKGLGQWTGNLGYGPYRIETRLSGHIDGMVQQTITETDANRTFTLPTPTPIYGSLRVETQPFQADIYLDGKNVGKTPKMLPEVIIGNHKIEVKMEGYENLSTTQAITEGQMAVVGGELTEKPKESAKELADIGENYYFGTDGYTKDYAKAVEYSRKAAELGSAKGQFRLGYCYDEGRGVNQDYSQAVYWYRKAAEQGYTVAQCNLGNMYALGEGVTKDYAQAVYWWRKAAENESNAAQSNLGLGYYYGRYGLPIDKIKAKEYFQKAADQGYQKAIDFLKNNY